MFFAQVQRRRLVKFVNFAVNACAYKSLCHQIGHQLHVLALAIVDHGCQQHQLATRREFEDLIHHLANGLCFQRDVVIRAARNTGTRVQQTQIVVNLGDGTNR